MDMSLGVTDIMIIDTWVGYGIIGNFIWWSMLLFIHSTGCGINYKKFLFEGFLGTGLIFVLLGCMQHLIIFST